MLLNMLNDLAEATKALDGKKKSHCKSFCIRLTEHGWKPPQEHLQEQQEVSLRSMRAIATAQPKASKMPPIVREHRKVVLITGPFADLAKAPVEPMQRLESSWEVPKSCEAELEILPEGAQLLRTTPLRSNGGLLVLNHTAVGVF